jgi:hypothetical protein
MGLATDLRYTVAAFLGRKPKPNAHTSRRIYAYTDKVFRASGGAPDKLVAMYKAHAPRHRE